MLDERLEEMQTIRMVVVDELPDVANKVYMLRKEIFNDKGKVVDVVHEEWIFLREKIGEYKSKEYEKHTKHMKDLPEDTQSR